MGCLNDCPTVWWSNHYLINSLFFYFFQVIKKYKMKKIMKFIVRGILQKLLKYWTIRRRNNHPSNPEYYIRDWLILQCLRNKPTIVCVIRRIDIYILINWTPKPLCPESTYLLATTSNHDFGENHFHPQLNSSSWRIFPLIEAASKTTQWPQY